MRDNAIEKKSGEKQSDEEADCKCRVRKRLRPPLTNQPERTEVAIRLAVPIMRAA
jgi:hypothetical protein